MDQATSSQKNTSKMAFQVVVDIHGGQTLLIDQCDTEEQFKTITVLQLKEKICEHTGWPVERACVYRRESDDTDDPLAYYLVEFLDDRSLLCDYGIQHMTKLAAMYMPLVGACWQGDEGIGDKDKSQSMERLADFKP